MNSNLYDKLKQNLELSLQNKDLNNEHKEVLDQLKAYIQTKLQNKEVSKLVFICTHNSRRSHISQFLAWAYSLFFDLKDIEFYSGGTEATAPHPNAMQALEDFGFQIRKLETGVNTKYEVYAGSEIPPLTAFSKIYNHPMNPKEGFAAIMVCDDAAENCPIVYGAEAKFKLTYRDPKIFDNTEQARTKYYEKVLEIALDMAYLFSELKKLL
ncbi:MAG: hypothetical protein N3A69_06315 [Leptospiraceae bacterium]|nr:hypothetical protein [Leptospiraceae bacterium]